MTTKVCSLCGHHGIAEGYLSDCEDQVRTLEWQLSAATRANERLRTLLKRLGEWDHMDAAADGPYWRAEIAKEMG